MNIFPGQASQHRRPEISTIDHNQVRSQGQSVPLAGKEQIAPGRERGPLLTVWELASGFTGVNQAEMFLAYLQPSRHWYCE